MPWVGGSDVLTLRLGEGEYAGDTSATVTATGPSDQTPTVPVSGSADRGTWTAIPAYDEAGRWAIQWDITGNGATTVSQEVWVEALSTPGARAAWRPAPWHVAAYVPRRTLVGAVDGHGNAINTFDDTTLPTNAVVWNLITDACAWVDLITGDLDSSLYDAARAVAARYAAAHVELGYPDNRDDLSNAEQLLRQAEQMAKALAARNTALTGDDPTTEVDELLPVWSFPAAPSYGDYTF